MRTLTVLLALTLGAAPVTAERRGHPPTPPPAVAVAVPAGLDADTRARIEEAVADARKALQRLRDTKGVRCEVAKERADLAAEQVEAKLERILLALERQGAAKPVLVQPVVVTETVETEADAGPPYLSVDEVERLSQAVAAESFAEDQLRVLRLGFTDVPIQAADAKGLLARFTFAEDKLKALQILAPHLYDRQNAFQLLDAFTFSDDKEAAQRILSR